MDKLIYYFSKALKKSRGYALVSSNVDNSSKVESGCTLYNTVINKHSFCGYDCTLINCTVGSFCSISNRVTIGGVAHPMHFVSTSPVFLSHKDSVKAKFAKFDFLPKEMTLIGSDVWIGEGSFIKAGVKVGVGAVIGMGSIVTKDVPDYAIVAGNPARIIRYRFDQDTIKGLLSSKWWELDDNVLSIIGHTFDNPKKFLRTISEL